MNVDTLYSKYKVVSKYFTGKTVMDESLTDFQEKKSFKVVKNIKAPAVKPKVKKVKRVKGQKDIRTALKQKKNELIAYSEDFDTVCKKSGIDVDSEQLQLAIALSKSLQKSETTEGHGNCSKSLTTQQRTGLIRTTLKEYGFKVPEKPNTNRKTKKRRKPYKLLLTSYEEKQQIITDRYSQLLFELNNTTAKTISEDLVVPNLFIYNLTTNMEYKNIKDDGIFYVENLIEEAPNTVGSLLKNWSDIPGRPLSPALDKSELIFSEIECSQEEMDIVLSGPLKYSKEILKKNNLFKDRGRNFNCSIAEQSFDKTTIESNPVFIEECTSSVLLTESGSVGGNISPKSINFLTVETDVEKRNIPVVTQPSRSLSPDLFDDEDDAEVEIPNETMREIINEPVNNVTKGSSEVMDLTECVNVMMQKNNNTSIYVQPVSQLSQQVDVTKRKSNDYMEITECVGGFSQNTLERIDGQIDLTGDSGNSITSEMTCAENEEAEGNNFQANLKNYDECIDLTSHCGKVIEIDKNSTCENVRKTRPTGDDLLDKIDEHIDLTGHCADMEKENKGANADHLEQMDLTQSSNSSTDTLPFVHISGKQTVPDNSLDNTIILNENEYLETSPVVNKDYENVDMKTQSAVNKTKNNSSNPLSQCSETKIQTEGNIGITRQKNILVETDKTPIINVEETYETVGTVDGNIDLTQSSNSNEASNTVFNDISNCINNSSLGKKDDVSVDYDEALENMNSFPYYTHDDNDDNSIELNHSPKLDEKVSPSNSRQSVMSVLELSDNELISPTKTKNVDDHFDFGGISVIDNLPSFSRKSRNTMNSIPSGSMSDSLPMVDVKGRASPEKPKSPFEEFLNPVLDPNKINHQSETIEQPNNTKPQTPQTKINRHLHIETPEQSEYIIKTDNVTPMLDFASMSTPERNRELDKYGLKPFKRKRAIQLLTHLYNQTHPYVESTDELTSPSKKRKKDDLSQPSPSKSSSRTSTPPINKSKSPRKASKSPRKDSGSPTQRADVSGNLTESDKENELFTVTSEIPAIRNIVCDADDWVFQKREKAKLHSCRVPLHIAFHNYVSCRRRLHEAILRYEPVNIDVIHRELAASGHRYDPKDLLKFMDKKCITVKTVDNAKNNKRC